MLTILFGLGAALAWGSADFSGGMAAKRLNAISVVLTAQAISALPLLLATLLFEYGIPRFEDIVLGALASLCSMIAVINLYTGLAKGRMVVVAPLAAIISTIISVLVSALTDGMSTPLQMLGFGLAVVAIWLISSDGQKFTATPIELRSAFASGVGFAGFFIIIDHVSGETVLWPILAARLTSLLVLSLYTFSRHQWRTPTRTLLPVIVLAGLLDTMGSFFYLLAAQTGRLDVAVVLASLYPAVTIMLAWLMLHEQLKLQQWFGVGVVLVAIVMIAL